MNADIYVYNLKQALFFIQHGLIPVAIDTNRGKVYHKFERTKALEKVFTEWSQGSKQTA